jgi:signal peptidase
MPKPRASKEEEEDEEGGWKSWVRDIAIAVLIMAVLLGAIYAYTGIWPPLVVVESSSMQHGHSVSYVGVIDTGDLVLVQSAPARSDVVTYLEGRASGYSTYGDYGDVIVFRLAHDPGATPIIHRAIMYVLPNGSLADVPDLARLPKSEWQGVRNGLNVSGAYGLSEVTIHEMGWQHNLGITFNLAALLGSLVGGHAGYITMGDNNAYDHCRSSLDPCSNDFGLPPYDTGWFPSQADIIGHARGEIPWFGLIKLLLTPSSSCCQGWGDPGAPANSWSSLALAIVFLIALPFLVEGAAWGWSKYAWPWIKLRIGRKEPEKPAPRDLPTEDEDEPKEGSSGP